MNGNSSAARRARVKLQLRDSKGRWIEMGRGGKWFDMKSGKQVSGTVVGFKGNKAIMAHTDRELVNGFFPTTDVDGSKLEMIEQKATLQDPKITEMIDAYINGLSGKDLAQYNARKEAMAKGRQAQEKAGLSEDSPAEGDVQDFIEVDDEDDDAPEAETKAEAPQELPTTNVADLKAGDKIYSLVGDPSKKEKTPFAKPASAKDSAIGIQVDKSGITGEVVSVKSKDGKPAYAVVKGSDGENYYPGASHVVVKDDEATKAYLDGQKSQAEANEADLKQEADAAQAEDSAASEKALEDKLAQPITEASDELSFEDHGSTGVKISNESADKPLLTKGSDLREGDEYYSVALPTKADGSTVNAGTNGAVKDGDIASVVIQPAGNPHKITGVTAEGAETDKPVGASSAASHHGIGNDEYVLKISDAVKAGLGNDTEDSDAPEASEQIENFEPGPATVKAEDFKQATAVEVGDQIILSDSESVPAPLTSAWIGKELPNISGKVGTITNTKPIYGANKTSKDKVVGQELTFTTSDGEKTAIVYDFAGKNGNTKGVLLASEDLKNRVTGGDDSADAPEDAVEDAPEAAAEAPDAIAELSQPSEPVNTEGWQKIGAQGGSNPGGTYKDPETGKEYYLKQSKSDLHAQNEVLADKFYEAAGIKTSRLQLADVGDGKLGTISEILEGSSSDLYEKINGDENYKKKFQEGFGMDAWLANWDVVGLAWDNALTDKDGDAVRIDPGGALLFRAMGDPKGSKFTDEVTEWESMRTGSNNTSQTFGSMTDEELYASVEKVRAFTPEMIDSLVDSVGMDEAKATLLKDKLKARQEDILAKADALGVDPILETPEDAPEAPEEVPADVDAPETPEAVESVPDAPESEESFGQQATDATPAMGVADYNYPDLFQAVSGTEFINAEDGYKFKKDGPNWFTVLDGSPDDNSLPTSTNTVLAKIKMEPEKFEVTTPPPSPFKSADDEPFNIEEAYEYMGAGALENMNAAPETGYAPVSPAFSAFPGYNMFQVDALDDFLNNSYRLNDTLRKRYEFDDAGIENHANWFAAMNSIMDKSPLTEGIELYRGLWASEDKLGWLMNDKMYADFGYTSSSHDSKVAFNWVNGAEEEGKTPVVFKIDLPKGFKAHAVDYSANESFKWADNEAEIILPHGTYFDVTNMEEYTTEKGVKGYIASVTPILTENNYIGDHVDDITKPESGTDTGAESGTPELSGGPDSGSEQGESGTTEGVEQAPEGEAVEESTGDSGEVTEENPAFAETYPDKGKTVTNEAGAVFKVNELVTHPKHGLAKIKIILPSTNSAKIVTENGKETVAQAHKLTHADAVASKPEAAVDPSTMSIGQAGIDPTNGKMFIVGKEGKQLFIGDKVSYTKKGVTQEGEIGTIYKSTDSVVVNFEDGTSATKKASQILKLDEQQADTTPEAVEVTPDVDPVEPPAAEEAKPVESEAPYVEVPEETPAVAPETDSEDEPEEESVSSLSKEALERFEIGTKIEGENGTYVKLGDDEWISDSQTPYDDEEIFDMEGTDWEISKIEPNYTVDDLSEATKGATMYSPLTDYTFEMDSDGDWVESSNAVGGYYSTKTLLEEFPDDNWSYTEGVPQSNYSVYDLDNASIWSELYSSELEKSFKKNEDGYWEDTDYGANYSAEILLEEHPTDDWSLSEPEIDPDEFEYGQDVDNFTEAPIGSKVNWSESTYEGASGYTKTDEDTWTKDIPNQWNYGNVKSDEEMTEGYTDSIEEGDGEAPRDYSDFEYNTVIEAGDLDALQALPAGTKLKIQDKPKSLYYEKNDADMWIPKNADGTDHATAMSGSSEDIAKQNKKFEFVNAPESAEPTPEKVNVSSLPNGTFVPNRTGSNTGFVKTGDNEWDMQVTGKLTGNKVTDDFVQNVHDINEPEIVMPDVEEEAASEAPTEPATNGFVDVNSPDYNIETDPTLNLPDGFDPEDFLPFPTYLKNTSPSDPAEFPVGTIFMQQGYNGVTSAWRKVDADKWDVISNGSGNLPGTFLGDSSTYKVFTPKPNTSAPEPTPEAAGPLQGAPENLDDFLPAQLLPMATKDTLEALPVGSLITVDNNSSDRWEKNEDGKWSIPGYNYAGISSAGMADGDSYYAYVPKDAPAVAETPEVSSLDGATLDQLTKEQFDALPDGTKLKSLATGTQWMKKDGEWFGGAPDFVAKVQGSGFNNMIGVETGDNYELTLPDDTAPESDSPVGKTVDQFTKEEFANLPAGTVIQDISTSTGSKYFYTKNAEGVWEIDGDSTNTLSDEDGWGSVIGDEFGKNYTVTSVGEPAAQPTQPSLLGKTMQDLTKEQFDGLPTDTVVTYEYSYGGKTEYTKLPNGHWAVDGTTVTPAAWDAVLGKPSGGKYKITGVGEASSSDAELAVEPQKFAQTTKGLKYDDFAKLPVGTKLVEAGDHHYEKLEDGEWVWHGVQGKSDQTDSNESIADTFTNPNNTFDFDVVVPEDSGAVTVPADQLPVTQDPGTKLSALSVEDIEKMPTGSKIDYFSQGVKLGTYAKNTSGLWDYTPEGSMSATATGIKGESFDYATDTDAGKNFIVNAEAATDVPTAPTNVLKGQKPTVDMLNAYPAGTTVKMEYASWYYGPSQYFYKKLENGNWEEWKKTNSTFSSKKEVAATTVAGSYGPYSGNTAVVSTPLSDTFAAVGTGELVHTGDTVTFNGQEFSVEKILKKELNLKNLSTGEKTKGKFIDITKDPSYAKIDQTSNTNNQSYAPDPISTYVADKAAAQAAQEALAGFAGADAEAYNAEGASVKSVSNPYVTATKLVEAGEIDTENPLYGAPKPQAPADLEYIAPFDESLPADLPKWDADGEWLKKVEQRYLDNPNKAKSSVQESNNWPKIQSALNATDETDLSVNLAKLLDSKYITDEMYTEAKNKFTQNEQNNAPVIEAHKANLANAKAEYEAAKAQKVADHEAKVAQYQTDLEAWMNANPSPNLMSNPVFPDFSTENFTGGEADWSKAHVGTYSLDSALEAVKNDTALANHGISVATDSDQIEDLDVNIHRILDQSGDEKIEIKFKVTSVFGKALDKKFAMDNVAHKSSASIAWLNKDAATGLLKETSSTKHDTSGKQYYYTDPATGARVTFNRPEDADEFSPSTHTNSIRIVADKDMTSADFQSILDNLGINAKPASEGDIKVYAENRLISTMLGNHDAKDNPSGATRASKLKQIEDKYGITPDNLVFTTDGQGRVKVKLDDEASAKMISYTGVSGFHHNFTGNDPYWMQAFQMITSATPGIMSTYQRWQHGIGTTGMSSSSDMGYSGGDYAFTKTMHGSESSSHNHVGVKINAKAALSRLDVYGNSGDNFGRHSSNAGITYDLMKGHPYEIMFRNGVPLSEWDGIQLDSSNRKTLLEKLEEAGILQINGIPIEKFVFTSQHDMETVSDVLTSIKPN